MEEADCHIAEVVGEEEDIAVVVDLDFGMAGSGIEVVVAFQCLVGLPAGNSHPRRLAVVGTPFGCPRDIRCCKKYFNNTGARKRC